MYGTCGELTLQSAILQNVFAKCIWKQKPDIRDLWWVNLAIGAIAMCKYIFSQSVFFCKVYFWQRGFFAKWIYCEWSQHSDEQWQEAVDFESKPKHLRFCNCKINIARVFGMPMYVAFSMPPQITPKQSSRIQIKRRQKFDPIEFLFKWKSDSSGFPDKILWSGVDVWDS